MSHVFALASHLPEAVPLVAHEPEVSPLVGGAAGMAATLVVGGLLLLLGPRFTDQATQRALDRPGRSFLYGLGVLILAIGLTVVLVLTVIGIVLLIPLFVILIFFGGVGYLAVGRVVSEDRWVMLLVAVVVAGITGAVPVLGQLIAFVVSTVGTGAASLEMYHAYQDG